METPTARVLPENKFRFGISQISPYRYYYVTVSPLKGLELDGKVTEFIDVPANNTSPEWQGYGNYKDKSVDLKYQFVKEGKYLPALAFGIMDPHGNRLFGGQYIVASKQIYPFDFTIGLGNGRLGKEPVSPVSQNKEFGMEILENPGKWFSDAQFFGGIQFSPSSKFAFMIEYNPIQYEKQITDPAQKQYFADAVSSKVNYGIRFMPFDWTEIDLSYQRGNQIGVNLSFAFTLGKPLLPIYDPPYIEKSGAMESSLAQRIARGLFESGFYDISVSVLDSEVRIVATNDRYFYNMHALGIMLKIIDKMLPPDIKKIDLILSERGIPVIEFSTAREDVS